jgi:hypothetical protein
MNSNGRTSPHTRVDALVYPDCDVTFSYAESRRMALTLARTCPERGTFTMLHQVCRDWDWLWWYVKRLREAENA